MSQSNRRQFLVLSLKAGGAMALAAATGCALFEDKEALVCTLDELKAEPFLIREFNRRKILIRELSGKTVIFSLICRHKRCTVKWVPRESIFQCPCHEGMYDAQGVVISGPPAAPLRRYQYEIRGDEVFVLNDWAS